MKRALCHALACAGAVVGAGFASGREIFSFFTQYGHQGGWLILLSGAVMTLLCALCMHAAAARGASCWRGLLDRRCAWRRYAAEGSVFALMAVAGGAMTAAAGHMIALLWWNEWAYAIGAVGTVGLAWLMTLRSLRPMSWISAVLTLVFLAAAGMAFALLPQEQILVIPARSRSGMGLAALRAAGYAAMNIALAVGVICESAENAPWRSSAVFGVLMTALLLVSHALYLRYPALEGEAFPIVRLLSAFGRGGFLLSALLMYLSVFTSLTAVMYALRCGLEPYVGVSRASWLSASAVLALSCAGFAEIVDTLYAPAGLACLALLFAPLAWRIRLDKAS